MNLLGIVLILLLASCFVLWVMNLVRTGHLYVGYAVVAVMAVAAGVLGLSVGPIRRMAVGRTAAVDDAVDRGDRPS